MSEAGGDNALDRGPSTPAGRRAKLARVAGEQDVFVGRENELDALRAALTEMRSGRGSVWLVTGEPGIGKSRLCEEMARLAAELGVRPCFGRCWEDGGAPAYWPWLQAFRMLLDESAEVESAFARWADRLVTLLPELRERFGEVSPPPSLEPEQARFQLLEAMTSTLSDSSRHVPLLVVLEDLHAADSSSVALLEFVSKLVRSMRVLVIGTLRDSDALWSAVAPALVRVQRQAEVLPLVRLSKQQVSSYLASAFPGGSDEFVEPLYRATEGHPLFLVEMARLVRARGAAGSAALAIPATVKIAIRERLDQLSAETRRTLEAASAFGRDVPHAPLAVLLGKSAAELSRCLAEATERSVLIDASDGASRFSHMLFQEVLHQDIEPSERERLHLSIAGILERSGDRAAPSSVLAHHYLRAGQRGREPGIEAALRAAAEATEQIAFDDAVDWHRAALDALDQTEAPSPARRCDLLLGLGRARFAAGQVAAAQQTARLAGDLAERIGDAERFAESALLVASAFVIAEVDPHRVALLARALEALPTGDASLRARVMARLAAASQPAADPARPIALAREAVAMARRVADDAALLSTLRSACSTMMDLAHPDERRALNLEHVRLAEKLREPVEVWRGHMRLVFDCIQLGEFDSARESARLATETADRLGHPHYQWGPTLLSAMFATAEGDWDRWESRFAAAERLAERCSDVNAPRTLALHRIHALGLQERYEEAVAMLPVLAERFQGTSIWQDFALPLSLSYRLHAHGHIEVDDRAFENLVRRVVALGDTGLAMELAGVCRFLGDRKHARTLYESFSALPARFMHGGMLEMTIKGPLDLCLGEIAMALGEADLAKRHFERAHAEAERVGAALFVGRARARLGGAPTKSQRPPTPKSAGEPALTFSLLREGDVWQITCGDGVTFRLKDSRGLQMLDRLVAEPGREFHALDLVSPHAEAHELGDAGEALDPQARAEYERRLVDLRAELEEAEEFGDIGRAESARAELDFLTSELSRALGVGKRARRTGSNAERARVNAQRRLRDAIRRIGEQHGGLGKHLERAVRTGTFCSYSPE